ncbi:MAG: D-alanyl-D-alanine carboxypeptidase [Ruminococcus sp.]|nr:D-alanyl-D-alanine carboxypeptidase [Ruminococcus sp.]
MKRLACVIIAFFITFAPIKAHCAEVSVSAGAAVLYCADNGAVYYSKNENKPMKPASTTKLMTTLLTLEYAAKNNKTVTFTKEMTAEGSSMYLKVGERVTLRDLAVGLMLCSGNDAANAAAISIAGSVEKFSELMNRRAAEIGMMNTHFVTPSGLDAQEHYSSALDLAVLMAQALKNPDFRALTARKTATVSFIKPKNKTTTYSNHNRLLSLYKHCIGGKTGFTTAAGRCLVSAAKKDGLTLVCVTLDDRRDWADHMSLYDYGFNTYKMNELDDTDLCLDVPTVGGKKPFTTVVGEGRSVFVTKAADKEKIESKMLLDNFIYAPVKKKQALGAVEYFYKGKIIASHKLRAIENNNSLIENKSFLDVIKGMLQNAF